MHWYWHDLAWNCYRSFFPHLYQSYGPWLTSKFRFRSISWELLNIFSPNFIYTFILARSSLGSLLIIFCKFVPELWPLIYFPISFPLNILRTTLQFFHRILYMHLYWQDLVWDCYTSFFGNLYQSYGPLLTPKFRFRSIYWETNGRISPKFINAFILTRSSLGLLHIIFRKFVPELWPFIYAKISSPLNILRTNW